MTTKNNNDLFLYKRNVVYKYLVGGVNPSEKYESQLGWLFPIYGYESIPINTIFSGMNIHLPAILGFTRYQGFDPSPYGKIKAMFQTTNQV